MIVALETFGTHGKLKVHDGILKKKHYYPILRYYPKLIKVSFLGYYLKLNKVSFMGYYLKY